MMALLLEGMAGGGIGLHIFLPKHFELPGKPWQLLVSSKCRHGEDQAPDLPKAPQKQPREFSCLFGV